MDKGLLITVSGLDGVGKSTIVTRICDLLNENDHRCISLKFPNKWVQNLDFFRAYVDDNDPSVPPVVVSLLMLADRLLTAEQTIQPSLARGISVVCDRYSYEIMAMARARRVKNPHWIDELLATLRQPDVALLLDAPPEEIYNRLINRSDDPLKAEERDLSRTSNIRTELLAVAKRHNVQVIDTTDGINATWQKVLKLLPVP